MLMAQSSTEYTDAKHQNVVELYYPLKGNNMLGIQLTSLNANSNTLHVSIQIKKG